MHLSQIIKAIPGAVPLKRKVYSACGWDDLDRGMTSINILKTFPQYKPCSAGTYQDRANLTIETINGLFASFQFLLETLENKACPEIAQLKSPEKFAADNDSLESAEELKKLFDAYGSDKARTHNYHLIYGSILNDRNKIESILEIGLGTNNTDIVSTMGKCGKPGASLRAFRDFCPKASIIGADIDSRVLFREERIKTFEVDQTSRQSVNDLQSKIFQKVDLLIDDGLHSPDANINTIAMGINIVNSGGWIVIEDIGLNALPIWHIVKEVMQWYSWDCTLFKTRNALLFAARKPLSQ